MAEFGYPRKSRLLNAADYKTVFDNNQYKVSCRYFLMLASTANECGKRLGIVVAKKNVAQAVQRNRIKRLIRDSFRNQNAITRPLDVIVLARRDAGKLTNSQVTNKLTSLWRDLESKLVGHNKSSLNKAAIK